MSAPVGIFVPLPVAALLHRSLPHGLAALLAGRHPDAERVLAQLRDAALVEAELRTRGTPPLPTGEQGPPSVTTGTAANRLGITRRGVRQAITRGRLPAREVDGHWVIERADLEDYAARRAG